MRFKADPEVNYGVHQQSEALVHVLAQSVDKPLSAVAEGEDVLRNARTGSGPLTRRPLIAVSTSAMAGSPPLASVMSDPPIGLAGPFRECP